MAQATINVGVDSDNQAICPCMQEGDETILATMDLEGQTNSHISYSMPSRRPRLVSGDFRR